MPFLSDRIIKMKFLLILFSLLLLLLFSRLWIGQGSYPDIWSLEQKLRLQQAANEKQTLKNHQLEAEVRALQSGDEAIEEYARDELGMIRKGESFYQVILKEQNRAMRASATVNTP